MAGSLNTHFCEVGVRINRDGKCKYVAHSTSCVRMAAQRPELECDRERGDAVLSTQLFKLLYVYVLVRLYVMRRRVPSTF